MNSLTARQINDLNRLNEKTKAMAFGTKFQSMIDEVNDVAKTGTPVNATNAASTLTLTGVVIDGETLVVFDPMSANPDTYEFLADTAQSKTTPTNIAVNIMASTTKATNTLTIPTQPTAGDTMSIGNVAYTFVANGTDNAVGEVSVGTDLASAKLAIVAAINGTDDHNVANSLVTASAFNVNVCTLTAIIGGAAGNAIATTETFTAVGNVFSAVALATGADCSAANAITALVAAITASDTQGVGASDGAGDTVVLTADVPGAAGGDIIVTSNMANCTFDATLDGGVDGTVGVLGENLVDATYLYILVADNAITGKNWRRISLGNVY